MHPKTCILPFTLSNNIASRIYEHIEGEGYACMNHVLNKLSFLPPPQNDMNALVTEQEMVAQRHRQDVEYLVTRGRGRRGATSRELDDVEDSCRQVEGEIEGKQFLSSPLKIGCC